MSRHALTHIAKGRAPWRPWVQLRETGSNIEAKKHSSHFLSQAASRITPSFEHQDWHWDDVRHRLNVLCNWLEKRLTNPIRIHKFADGAKRVDLFDTVTYTVFPNTKGLIGGKIIGGNNEYLHSNVEVGKPLSSAHWIEIVIDHLGLGNENQGELFNGGHDPSDITEWLASTAYKLLRQDPLFKKLRSVSIPKALDLPKDILGIALASRIRPRGAYLTSRELNLVLWNPRAFKQVARENPQLLPLLYAFLSQIPKGTVVNSKDPVSVIKSAILGEGLSEASWRYLTRHGSRLFRIPWNLDSRQSAFRSAINYLRMLEYADLPPPPPPSVARALLHGYNEHAGHRVLFSAHFESRIDPVGLRLGLLEADKLRHKPGMAEFIEEFMGVCWWSSAAGRMADKNQVKAGWPWLVRHWRQAEDERYLLAATNQITLLTTYEEFEYEGWLIVPITSSADLTREALAMRNCLQSFMASCESGSVEIYSVRDKESGKRKACIGFRHMSDEVRIIDVKGYANTPPSKDIERIANDMCEWLHYQNVRRL